MTLCYYSVETSPTELARHEEMKAVVDGKLCINTASSHSAVIGGSVPIVTQLELDLQL